MRRVTNEQLATAFTLQRMQPGPYLVQRLGRSRETDMSPVRRFQEFHYYSYGDGSAEFLVVSPSEDRLFGPLLDLRLGDVDLDAEGALRVGMVGGADSVEILSADLVLGDSRDRVPGAVRLPQLVVELDRTDPSMRLGSIAQIDVTFTRFDKVLSTGLPLPYVRADDVLGPVGLAVRDTDEGLAYVFRNDPSEERLEELADLIETGLVPARFVDVVGKLGDGPGAGAQLVSVAGCEFLLVDARGYRHVIHDSSQRLHRLGDARAAAIAETLRLDARPRHRQGPLRSWVQPAGQALRRNTRAASVRALGFEHYQRARLALQFVRTPPTPYQSYAESVDHSSAVAGTVLVDGYNGRAFDGSMLALAREGSASSPELTWTVAARAGARPALAARLARYGIRARTVAHSSEQYYSSLRTAQILMTDSTLPSSYVRTRGQTLINTWHGTPLKRMGRHIEAAPLAMANVQRNLLLSDVIALNNTYALDRMRAAFMLDGSNFRMLPSPRVSMMLDLEASAGTLREELRIGPDELVVAWLPTWRGNASGTVQAQPNLDLFTRMAAVRQRTRRPMRFFAKPHPFLAELVEGHPFTGFESVPEHLDLYEFLTIVDVLVTDFSSVMYDFAVRNRPVILDVPDLEQYTAERGLYVDIAALPFRVTRSPDELVSALESVPREADHTAFNEEYNPLESTDGVRTFLDSVLNAAPELADPRPTERVLIFPGGLKTNGITTSFLNLLSHLGQERDFEILLPLNSLSGQAGENLRRVLDAGYRCIVAPRGTIVAPSERLAWSKFRHRLELDGDDRIHLEAVFDREARRLLGLRSYDQTIHFSGYDALPAGVLAFRSDSNHVFIHSNMAHELALRNNFNAHVLQWAYQRARTIPVVSDALRTDLVADGYLPVGVADRVRVVHNTLDLDLIVRRSRAREDYLTAELTSILEDRASTGFVNIGRFSPEKGQDRLIRAFEAVCSAEPHSTFQLFLIGGPGSSRAKLYGMRDHSPFAQRIHLFEDINPMPILARCDLFVQSSLYEGFGMALLEAIALGVPVLSTRMPGPQEFLESGYGYVVENSTDGLITGMTDFIRGRLAPITKSLKEYNRQAVEEFFGILA